MQGHVLIVDDEAALRTTLAQILQRVGLQVTTAENAEQALRLVENQPFDLVYMDIRMPGLPGLEAVSAVHNLRPGLPVILFTAQPDLNSAVEALRRGAADYLLKPLKPEIILSKTETLLTAQRKERRRREILAQIETLQAELKALDAGEESTSRPEQSSVSQESRYLTLGTISLDQHTRRLTVDGKPASLPPASFDVLLSLARHAPEVVSYETLVTEALGYRVSAREAQEIVKWHVHHIRQAIEPAPQDPQRLVNLRGVGYRLTL